MSQRPYQAGQLSLFGEVSDPKRRERYRHAHTLAELAAFEHSNAVIDAIRGGLAPGRSLVSGRVREGDPSGGAFMRATVV